MAVFSHTKQKEETIKAKGNKTLLSLSLSLDMINDDQKETIISYTGSAAKREQKLCHYKNKIKKKIRKQNKKMK